jgi:hypothetical protein
MLHHIYLTPLQVLMFSTIVLTPTFNFLGKDDEILRN